MKRQMGAKTSGNFWHIILGHGPRGVVGAQRIEIMITIIIMNILDMIMIITIIIRRATRPRAVLDAVPPPFVLGPRIISSL